MRQEGAGRLASSTRTYPLGALTCVVSNGGASRLRGVICRRSTMNNFDLGAGLEWLYLTPERLACIGDGGESIAGGDCHEPFTPERWSELAASAARPFMPAGRGKVESLPPPNDPASDREVERVARIFAREERDELDPDEIMADGEPRWRGKVDVAISAIAANHRMTER